MNCDEEKISRLVYYLFLKTQKENNYSNFYYIKDILYYIIIK